MKRVIINGDDYGYTPEKSEGILRAHREGILTSTTVMLNTLPDEWRDRLMECRGTLGVGLHLNITFGKPLSAPDKVPSLLDERGLMFRPQVWTRQAWDEFGNRKNPPEVELEFRAQIRMFQERLGMMPSHLDSHHFSASHPQLFPVLVRLAEELRLPIRLPGWIVTDDRFETESSLEKIARTKCRMTDFGCWKFFCNSPQPVEEFGRALKSLGEGTTEFMFHPSTSTATDKRSVQGRGDLDILTHPEIKKTVIAEGIHLINYKEVL